MNKSILFVFYVIATVFGFMILNFGLYEFFQSTLGASKDLSKQLLIWGWGAILIINLFYFGIIKGFDL